jgi:hypothetical protein
MRFVMERLWNYGYAIRTGRIKEISRGTEMAKHQGLFLLKSSSDGMKSPALFRTGEAIPESGIYRVIHSEHRLPHEVTLLRDEIFPKCAKCQDFVTFELLRGVVLVETLENQMIRLYELPEMDEEQQVAV